MRAGARAALVAWALAAATTAACGDGSVSRGEVLADLAAEAIVPAYERMSTSARGLQSATQALCDAARSGTPQDTAQAELDEARAALADTVARWSFLEAMWAGPVMARRSWAVIDWPVDANEIEALIADNEPIDVERLTLRIGADQRGLRAVEYILTTTATNTADTAANATDTDTAAVDADVGIVSALSDRRRCGYLTGLTEVIADEADLLYGDWAVTWEDGPAYPDVWAAPDGGDGIDDLVNDSLFLLEAISDRELGAVIGLMGDPATGLMDDPADAEEPPDAEEPSEVEEPPVVFVTDMRDHLRGLRAVLVGDAPDGGGRGLGPLLGSELLHRLRDLLGEADTALGVLPARLRITPSRPLGDVEHARDAIKAVQVVVATEVVGRLGVAIGFSDADGDSSN